MTEEQIHEANGTGARSVRQKAVELALERTAELQGTPPSIGNVLYIADRIARFVLTGDIVMPDDQADD